MTREDRGRDTATGATALVEGRIERVLWVSADHGFAVLRVATAEGPTIVVGPLGALSDHDEASPVFATFEGTWEQHATHGHRFAAHAFLVGSPRTRDGIALYLASARIQGVGPALAGRILDAFGDDTLRVLEQEPERLSEVRGLGERRAAAIVEAWQTDARGRAVTIMLRGLGVTPGRIGRIQRTFGDKAFEVVQREPYRLSEVPTIGFVLADRIARAQGLAADAPERVQAAIRHVVRRAEDDGDCWVPRDDIARRLRRLDVPVDGLDNHVDALLRDGGVEETPDAAGVAHPVLASAESRVASHLAYRMEDPAPQVDVDAALGRVRDSLGISLDPSQEAALRTVLSSPVAVLTGGPGTGKTTLVRAVLRVWADQGVRASLAAPTGRAARRMGEATGREATTLHRLLEATPGDGFGRNASNPLDIEALVVDEASMVDVRLMGALLDALPAGADAQVAGCPLLLVGDADQLPSVGPGQVLRDLVDGGVVPVARLDTVHRQGARSGIVDAARQVHGGRVPPSGEDAGWDDFFLVRRDDPLAARDAIVEIVTRRLPSKGLDPFRDVVVLAPTRRGPLGTQELNATLRAALHPAAANAGPSRLVEGDRVICVRNRHDLDVYNGDLGRVEEVARDTVRIRFDERVVDWPREDLDQIDLAYCVTVHKSQGSEYPAVVLAMHRTHGIMLRRTLLYTAVTRAKRFFCAVGDPGAWARAVATPDDGRRTTLRDRLASLRDG